jgi:Outer membrane protein beta-barrel domain
LFCAKKEAVKHRTFAASNKELNFFKLFKTVIEMKNLLMLVFAIVANFTLVSGQVQIFAGGSIQSYSKGIYQFGVPVDIRLAPKFAISTGISYASNKATEVTNETPIRAVRDPGGYGSGWFSSGQYFEPSVTFYYKSKRYNQNFLSVPLAIKYNGNADENRTSFMMEAGINIVYALNGQLNQFETSGFAYEKDVTINISKVPNEKFAATPVETLNYTNEGVNRLNAEWRFGLGMRLPGNFQMAIRWEKTIVNQYNDSKGYEPIRNGNVYFSVNVPVYKIKKKS